MTIRFSEGDSLRAPDTLPPELEAKAQAMAEAYYVGMARRDVIDYIRSGMTAALAHARADQQDARRYPRGGIE